MLGNSCFLIGKTSHISSGESLRQEDAPAPLKAIQTKTWYASLEGWILLIHLDPVQG